MSPTLQAESRRTRAKWPLGLLALMLVAGALTTLLVGVLNPKSPVGSSAVAAAAVPRANLVLVAGRLCLSGQTNPFTGIMVEHSADGSLRSRSSVSNGWLHGISEGWRSNGQLQVTEHFKAGVSHGRRTKWHPNGGKLSEGDIVDGEFHGLFRRWSENGVLVEQVEFVRGKPDGLALAYFESGFLKSKTTLQTGKIVDQTFWKDGEHREAMARLPAPVFPAGSP